MARHNHPFGFGHSSSHSVSSDSSSGELSWLSGLNLASHNEVFGQLTFTGFLRAFAHADDAYFADLHELNNSDVEGGALLLRNDDHLTVITAATGVEPGQVHPQHIHGFENGMESNVPTLAQDADRDGFIELAEGQQTYGPILLNLNSPPGSGLSGFPMPSGDSFLFAQTYDLSDPANGPLASLLDDAPLGHREIVLHGETTLEGHGAGTGGEVDGTAGYKPTLPIAAGEIQHAKSSHAAIVAFADAVGDAEGHSSKGHSVHDANEGSSGPDTSNGSTDADATGGGGAVIVADSSSDDQANTTAPPADTSSHDQVDDESTSSAQTDGNNSEQGMDTAQCTGQHGGDSAGEDGSANHNGSGTHDAFGQLTFTGFLRAFAHADDAYFADLNELNNSDVEGGALLLRNDDHLTVITAATGVEPGQVHPQHIHGFENGMESNVPTLAQDADRDGFIELAEGQQTYGPILLNLNSPPGSGLSGFPMPSGDSFLFAQTYDLSDPANGPLASLLDDAPLGHREIVLHGETTLEGHGAGTGGEVDGTAGYKPTLPIAAGEIQHAASSHEALTAFVDTLDHFGNTNMAQINDLMLS